MTEERNRRGLMLVISSPSGAGKTTLSKQLRAAHPELELSVSCTTRKPRSGEQDGREYHFIAPERFAEMIREDAFLEHAEVHENHYGTPSGPVMQALEQGKDILFDIDWQGAMAIAGKAKEDVVRVFILPPTMADLAHRLHTRAQDDIDVIERRLGRARGEIRYWLEYDYVLVNDDVARAYQELETIYRAETLKRSRNPWLNAFVQKLLDED
jgi:guanylate kinase